MDGSEKKGKETEDTGKCKAEDCCDMVGMAHQLGFGMGGTGLDVGTLDALISAAGPPGSGEDRTPSRFRVVDLRGATLTSSPITTKTRAVGLPAPSSYVLLGSVRRFYGRESSALRA